MLLSITACGNGTTQSTGASTPASGTEAPKDDKVKQLPDISWYRGDIKVFESKDTGAVKKTPAGTVIYGNSGQIVGADLNNSMEEYPWSHNVYDSLLERDLTTQGKFVNHLATEVAYDENGNLNITLRPNVKFHDGTILDADDVLFTFKYISGATKSRGQSTMKKIDFEKSQKIDDLHLTIVFKEPAGNFLTTLASGFCGIMSKEFVESHPDYAFLDGDAGSGPYKLVETITGNSQIFKRFDEYWGGKPDVETVIYKLYKDYTPMAIDFINGDLDFCLNNNFIPSPGLWPVKSPMHITIALFVGLFV
jgi:ABC-type transport system substrate-binding protein